MTEIIYILAIMGLMEFWYEDTSMALSLSISLILAIRIWDIERKLKNCGPFY